MFISILDFQKGEVIIEEVIDSLEDTDEYVSEKMGHSDYYYMTTQKLKLKINEDEL